MSKEIALNDQLDFFAQYGQVAGGSSSIIGKLLRFTKGEFVAGQEGEEVKIGTKLAVNMDSVLTGWVRWEQNRPTEQLMGPICEGFQPAKRDDLGHSDKKAWETGNDGEPRDPWQFANQFLAKSTDKKGELYTFTTNSKGGFGAVGKLCTAYSVGARERPGQYPVVGLEVDSYKHTEYGKIYVPVFTITSWVPKATFKDVEKEEAAPATRKLSSRKA